MNKSLKAVAITAGAALAVGVGITTAIAAIPDSNAGTITGCYASSGGALRIIDAQSGASCTSAEHRITWPSKGIRTRGTWSSTSTYYVDDFVTYNGQSYVAKLQNHNVTPANTTNWTLLAAKGATGARGPAGPAGSGPGTALQATNDLVMNQEEDHPVEIASFALPAGSWLVQSNVVVSNASTTQTREGVCVTTTDDGTAFIDGFSSSGTTADSSLTTTRAITVPADTTLRLSCYWVGTSGDPDTTTGVEFNRDSLVATPLDGVTDHNDTTASARTATARKSTGGAPSAR